MNYRIYFSQIYFLNNLIQTHEFFKEVNSENLLEFIGILANVEPSFAHASPFHVRLSLFLCFSFST
jgi:hypothetical protein